MEKVKFNPNVSWGITICFLDYIWDHRHERLPPTIEYGFGTYLGNLNNDPAAFDFWMDNYKLVFGRTPAKNDLLTEEEIFTAMIELSARFSYLDGLFDLVNFLHSMRYNPDEYHKEWGFWKKALISY